MKFNKECEVTEYTPKGFVSYKTHHVSVSETYSQYTFNEVVLFMELFKALHDRWCKELLKINVDPSKVNYNIEQYTDVYGLVCVSLTQTIYVLDPIS